MEEDEAYQRLISKQPKFYEIAYYGDYFDVTTMDILDRMRKSLWPFCTKSGIFPNDDSIDLYGPIWIMITLIVEIAIVGYVNYQIEAAAMELELANSGVASTSKATAVRSLAYYSLEKVARSSFVIMAYFLAVPLLMLLIIKYVLNIDEI